jgi:hypothetical protein
MEFVIFVDEKQIQEVIRNCNLSQKPSMNFLY